MVKNWNFCLNQASGEAVKLMGGDDRLNRPDCLSRQWQSLQTSGVALAASARNIIDPSSYTIKTLVNLPYGFFSTDQIIPKILDHQDNLLGEPVCCLFRRSGASRGFLSNLHHSADIEMWLHLAHSGVVAYDPEPLVSFRKHFKQASSANIESGLALQEHLLLLLEHASSDDIPPTTKFHVLWRAENALRVTPSKEIHAAALYLALQLGWRKIFVLRILHRMKRTMTSWANSLRKRFLR